jgi:hypothetical protein
MAREVKRKTLKWKKEQQKKKIEVTGATAITCQQDSERIDFSICATRQMRYADGCIGCRKYGG